MAYYFLKHYYYLHGLGNPTWLDCDLVHVENFEDQFSNIKSQSPDMLALSVFVWNERTQFKLAMEYKRHNPNSIIVMGGPQLTAHKDKNFFKSYPYVDYVVYGDGEKPFQQLIDYHMGNAVDKKDFVNIIENQGGIAIKYPFEMISDDLYLSTSPFLSQTDFIRDNLQRYQKFGIGMDRIKVGIEFARGCMYKCTFCDWSQNLTKKVKRRKHNWKDELLYFKDLDVQIRETDANFGQWDQDLEIFDYATSLYDPSRNFSFIPNNTPKLKRKSAYYIIQKVLETYDNKTLPWYPISLQDIDPVVLKAVDRPSPTLEQHNEMISKLKEDSTVNVTDRLAAQVVLGMPEQTFDNFVDNMHTVWKTLGIRKFDVNHWSWTPNSPAANADYVEKYQLETVPVVYLKLRLPLDDKIYDLDTLFEQVKKRFDYNHYFIDDLLMYKTHKMDFSDMHSCVKVLRQMQQYPDKDEFTSLEMQEFKREARKYGDMISSEADRMFEKHGFYILAKYDEDTNSLLPSEFPITEFKREKA
jgi:tRNA A37 methylthiotransferase MiaB|tara:strand:+ start:574 stop:2151 length:1578 start_codon:yes stop_codon:yes gene_type:complete